MEHRVWCIYTDGHSEESFLMKQVLLLGKAEHKYDVKGVRDSLMPKERCPVCAIEITHKNLARHIKLRYSVSHNPCLISCHKLCPIIFAL